MLIRVCLRILASSRIPRYDIGRQTPHFWGGSVTMPMKMNLMPQPRAKGWMSRLGYPERSWQCGCNSLHRDPILSRIRLMSIMKPEPGALVPTLGAASSGLCLPRRQRSMTWRCVECHKETWRRTSKVSWFSQTDLERSPFLVRLCRRLIVRYLW
jgi:hypothetical protein